MYVMASVKDRPGSVSAISRSAVRYSRTALIEKLRLFMQHNEQPGKNYA
jgi:hypothetical protein